MNWETLLSFGDSITIGARSYLGYPEYAAAALEQSTQKRWEAVNFATCGYTVANLLRHTQEHRNNLTLAKPAICSLLIGTNDLKVPTTTADFSIAYQQLVTRIQLISGHSRLLLITIPNMQPGIMLPYNMEMNETVEQFNEIIADIAASNQLELFSFALQPHHFYDGVHLNAEGSREAGQQLALHILNMRGLKIAR